jgi:L-ascorbate metabolism protein UlaG (beta-lactamase superfamily)
MTDPDALFPPGPTTRRGLLSLFGRRAAQSLPDVPSFPGTSRPSAPPPEDDRYFDDEPPDYVEPVLAGEDFVSEVLASKEENGLHVWWLGQAGFLLAVEGETMLIDPYLSDSVSEARRGTPGYERITTLIAPPELLSFVDAVLCSNARLDHLDPGTLPGVLAGGAAFGCAAGTQAIAEARAGRMPDVVLASGDQAWLGNFTVNAVPAYHADAPETVGYVIRHGIYSVYFAGDSRRVQGMAEAVVYHGPDIALVPINGTNGNMNGADAARLAFEAGAPIAVPCHYEMFRSDTAGVSRFVAECVRIGQEYRLPLAGERVTVDYGY